MADEFSPGLEAATFRAPPPPDAGPKAADPAPPAGGEAVLTPAQIREQARQSLFSLTPPDDAASDADKAAFETNKADLVAKAGILGGATWSNKDNDSPVNVTGYWGKGTDGREYVSVEGSTTGIPLDELKYPDPEPQDDSDSFPGSGSSATADAITSAQPAEVRPQPQNQEWENRPESERVAIALGAGKKALLDEQASVTDPDMKQRLGKAAEIEYQDSDHLKAFFKELSAVGDTSSDDSRKALAKDARAKLAGNIQVTGKDGKAHTLKDLDAERASATPDRQKEIDEIIEEGEFSLKVKQEDTRTSEEIADQSLDATIQFYEKRIKDAKEKDKNADTSSDDEALRIATAAKGAKGYKAMFTAGAIRGLNKRLRDIPGAEGLVLSDEAMAGLAVGEQAAIAEFLNDLHSYTGIVPDRGLAMLDLARNGDFSELMRHPALKEMHMVNKLYGQEFKKPEDAAKYVDQLLDLLEQEKYKKLKGMGIVGILMLAAAMSLKDMGANALSGGGGR